MLLAITGGIGSGKSQVATYWADHFNLPLINLDGVCRELLEQEQAGWLALQSAFADRFFDEKGNLDRSVFRKALFQDPCFRKTVDALLHPLAKSRMQEQCQQENCNNHLIEVPLLYEAGWQNDFDRVVVVNASRLTRIARIMARDTVSEQEAAAALAAQMPLAQKILLADHVIENDGAWAVTCQQINDLGRQYG